MRTFVLTCLCLAYYAITLGQITQNLKVPDPRSLPLNAENISILAGKTWVCDSIIRVMNGDSIPSSRTGRFHLHLDPKGQLRVNAGSFTSWHEELKRLERHRLSLNETQFAHLRDSIRSRWERNWLQSHLSDKKGHWSALENNRLRIYLDSSEEVKGSEKDMLQIFFPEVESCFVIYTLDPQKMILARITTSRGTMQKLYYFSSED